MEIRKALCTLRKTGRAGLQIVIGFQLKIFMNSNYCIFSFLEKHQHHGSISGLGSPDQPFSRTLGIFSMSINLQTMYL